VSSHDPPRVSPRALLFDIDGVFYVGDEPVPGGEAVIEWVRRRNIPHLFVTNTTSHPRTYLAKKLARYGVDIDPERIVSPAVAAREWLVEHGRTEVALFVPAGTKPEFADLHEIAAESAGPLHAVVVGDLGEGWDYPTLNSAFRLLMREPRPSLVSLGMTRYWRDLDGLHLDAGPFAQALAFATGCEPVITGKPASGFFAAAAHRLGVPAAELVMVGDDIHGDVGGAQQAGMRGVLVCTGKFRSSDLESGVTPDAVLDSVADLPDWWP
jgi:phospholysine phosphohistidine inorganic pyrophosphate phosphatase